MTNPDPDAELITKMLDAWFNPDNHGNGHGMRRILAVVRSHEAPKPSPAPKRVAVQIAMNGEDCLFALANDGTIHCGWYAGAEFSWRQQLPPLPQLEDAS